MAKLIKSHSNFIIRRKAQLSSLGPIYERDWMSVSEMDGFAPEAVPVYQSGTFKMTINPTRKPRRKQTYGVWVKNGEDDFWTLENTDKIEAKVDTTILNPNYTSLTNFAYYGSATELVKAGVANILRLYPGEIVLTDTLHTVPAPDGDEMQPFIYRGNENEYDEEGIPMYIVDNPFDININNEYQLETEGINPDRYMCLSANKYEVIFDEGGSQERRFDICWKVNNEDNECIGINLNKYIVAETLPQIGRDDKIYLTNPMEFGDSIVFEKWGYINNEWVSLGAYYQHPYQLLFTVDIGCALIYGIYLDGKTMLFHDGSCSGFKIRMKDEYIDQAFARMGDFERTLLPRDTKPKYTAIFDTPKETDFGHIFYKQAYTWPTIDGWNLDFSSGDYESYLNSLLDIAHYYDEYQTDNIYRSMTHESIKNFDWTTAYTNGTHEIDSETIEEQRLINMLRVYGRQFDELKRYIENIKLVGNLSYNKEDNMPDNILYGMLEYDGWVLTDTGPVVANTLETNVEYPAISINTSPEKSNIEFMRRLALNSRAILSRKGTREGLKMIYALFGIPELGSRKHTFGCDAEFNETGYSIKEYDVIATKFPTGEDYADILNINMRRNNFFKLFEETGDSLYGLMATNVGIMDDDNNLHNYLIPWYSKERYYDGNPYFQMFGGWGHRDRKKIDLSLAPEVKELATSPEINTQIYDETVKNIRLVDTPEDLKNIPLADLNEGDVYFTFSLGDYLEEHPEVTNTVDLTNYFVFAKKEFTGSSLGVEYNEEYVWEPILYSDFNYLLANPETLSDLEIYRANLAARVLYYESINDVSAGNNPHNGTKYDMGEEYFKHYDQLFYATKEADEFTEYYAIRTQQNMEIEYRNRFYNPDNPEPLEEDITEDCEKYGFGVSDENGNVLYTEDNKKVWFFLNDDTINDWNALYKEEKTEEERFEKSWRNIDLTEEFAFYKQQEPVSYDCIAYSEEHDAWLLYFNPERIDGLDYSNITELSSYSVINTKKLVITYRLSEYFRDYITNSVEPYIKQMVPSTTILEFQWEDPDAVDYSGSTSGTCRSEIYGMVSTDPTIFAVLADEKGGTANDAKITITPNERYVSPTQETTSFDVSTLGIDFNTLDTL